MIEPKLWTPPPPKKKGVVWPARGSIHSTHFQKRLQGSTTKRWSPVHIPHPAPKKCKSGQLLHRVKSFKWDTRRFFLILHPSTLPLSYQGNSWNISSFLPFPTCEITMKMQLTRLQRCRRLAQLIASTVSSFSPKHLDLASRTVEGHSNTEIDSCECWSGQQWQTQSQIQGVSRQTEWKS